MLEETVGARSAATFGERHVSRGEIHARLTERRDQQTARLVIRHRLPVLSAGRARADEDWLVERHLEDVGPVARHARLWIDTVVHVLVDHFLVTEELSRAAIDLPENAGLAGVERHFLIADVDEHTLEDLVEIEGLRGRVLVVPRELASVRIQRDR